MPPWTLQHVICLYNGRKEEDKSLNWVTSDNVQSLSKKKITIQERAIVKMRGARGAWWKGVVRDVKPIASTTLDDRMAGCDKGFVKVAILNEFSKCCARRKFKTPLYSTASDLFFTFVFSSSAL